jgi:hypothetical protein
MEEVLLEKDRQLLVVVDDVLARGKQSPAVFQHSGAFGESASKVAKVMKRLTGVHYVKSRIAEWKRFCETLPGLDAAAPD